MSTFIIGGIAANRALTTRRMPSFLEIIRNGRKALNALSAFRDLSWEVFTLPVSWNKVNISNREANTTVKSRMFQPFLMYGVAWMLELTNPSAIILIHASSTNKKVNTKFILSRANEKFASGLFSGLSTILWYWVYLRTNIKLLSRIRAIMK